MHKEIQNWQINSKIRFPLQFGSNCIFIANIYSPHMRLVYEFIHFKTAFILVYKCIHVQQ